MENREFIINKHNQQLQKLWRTVQERIARYWDAVRRLSTPFCDYLFENEGIIQFELKQKNSKGEVQITLEYELGTNAYSLFNPKDTDYSESIRKIRKLRIESARFLFDTEMIPVPKHGIFFMANNRMKNASKWKQIFNIGGYKHAIDEITVDFPLNAPIGILLLLHEFGHFLRAKRLQEPNFFLENSYSTLDKEPYKLTYDQGAAILEEERSADAVALKEASEFLSPVVGRRVISDFVHSSLAAYSHRLVWAKQWNTNINLQDIFTPK